MADDRKRVRESLLYEFRLGHSVDEAHQNLSKVYAENAPSERTCYRWFKKFRAGNFSMEEEERFGRPNSIDVHKLIELIESDSFSTSSELSSLNALKEAFYDIFMSWDLATNLEGGFHIS